MVNFELNKDACEGKACYSNITSSCNLKIIHTVISLSNQISDFHLLDDKINVGTKHPGNHPQNLASRLCLLHWQAALTFLPKYLN